MTNKRGMALVVAILTSFILMALVASLFWVVAATSRQAEYERNSAIALNLAEAGVADAVYRLNYCNDPTGLYPFDKSFFPLAGTAGDTSVLVDFPQDILRTTTYPNLAVILTGTNNDGIHGTLNGGDYYVGLLDENSSPDTIISVGFYKGTRRILTIPLRGENSIAYGRQTGSTPPVNATQGISEAFNKHAVYAYVVDTVAPATGHIGTGNVVYVDPLSSAFPSDTTTYTKTQISPDLFAPPVPNPPPDPILNPDPGMPTAGTIRRFKDDDGLSPYVPASGAYEATFPHYVGLTGSPGVETYTINDPSGNIGANEAWYFYRAGTNLLQVIINLGGSPPPVVAGKVAVIGGGLGITGSNLADSTIGNTTPGQVVLWADNDLSILMGSRSLTINGDVFCGGNSGPGYGVRIATTGTSGLLNVSGWIKSNGIISNGDAAFSEDNLYVGQDAAPTGLIATGDITLYGGNIYGSISSATGIDILGGAAATVKIYADSTAVDTALLVSASGGAATVNIDVPLVHNSATSFLKLGSNEKAALTVYNSNGSATVNINSGGTFDPSYSKSTQAAIAAFAAGGPAIISAGGQIGSNGNGSLVYAVGSDMLNSRIEIAANQTVYGSLVTSGTARLNNNSRLIYDPANYIGADPSGDLFVGFGGGRRAYVPAWEAWRLR